MTNLTAARDQSRVTPRLGNVLGQDSEAKRCTSKGPRALGSSGIPRPRSRDVGLVAFLLCAAQTALCRWYKPLTCAGTDGCKSERVQPRKFRGCPKSTFDAAGLACKLIGDGMLVRGGVALWCSRPRPPAWGVATAQTNPSENAGAWVRRRQSQTPNIHDGPI